LTGPSEKDRERKYAQTNIQALPTYGHKPAYSAESRTLGRKEEKRFSSGKTAILRIFCLTFYNCGFCSCIFL